MNSGKVKSCGLDLESPKNDFSDGGEYRNAQMSNFWVKKRSIWIISTEIQLKQTEKKEKVWNLIWGKEGEKRSKNETVIKDGDDHIGHKEEEFAESLFARPSVLTIPTRLVGCLCQYYFFSVFLNEASMAVLYYISRGIDPNR